jgi:hypothetical protein
MAPTHSVVVGYEIHVYERLPSGECGPPVRKLERRLLKADREGAAAALALAEAFDAKAKEALA